MSVPTNRNTDGKPWPECSIEERMPRIEQEMRLKEEKLDIVLAMIRAEVLRAMVKHPPMNSPHEGASVIREEFEELWDHVKADTGRSNDAIKEAVQTACTACRYVVDLCPL